MAQVDTVRGMYYDQGKSISEIARMTNNDRKTIRKYIFNEDWNMPNTKPPLSEDVPKLTPYKPKIDQWIETDRLAKRKQRHTAKRVYDRLVEEHEGNFTCSYHTVAKYVAEKKKAVYGVQPGFLPLEHPAGEAQADFGDAQFYENGHLYDGKYLNISYPYSNQGYLQLFKGENEECLFKGMQAIFEHVGSIPFRIWFDNTSTIVTKILKGGDRKLTDGFLRFKAHYLFEAVFCNPHEGHEKGSVESKVDYHRRNMLVPVPQFNSLAEYNKQLLERCDADAKREHYRKNATIEQLFEEDKEVMHPLPGIRLDTAKYITVKTNSCGKFLINGLHEYSVSPKYANAMVTVKLTSCELIVLDENQREIVRHKRLYGNQKQQSMQWLPYLTQLSRSPSALKYTGVYSMLPSPIQDYLEKCDRSEKGKVLRAIASLCEKENFEQATKAVAAALNYETFNSDSLLRLNERLFHNVPDLPALETDKGLPSLPKVVGNLDAYDIGIGKRGGKACRQILP
jgi:transposase